MRVSVFAYSRQGCETAKKIAEALFKDSCRCYTMEKFLVPGFSPMEKPSRDFYGRHFSESDAMIFVGSCGIAVRQVAPHVKDKKLDPAVLCIDELGTYVIPILSGHIGGANALAWKLSEALGATPVITTATDINGKFSVDTWASQNGCYISSMSLAKAVSARILEQPVPLCSQFPIKGELPAGAISGDRGNLGIYVGWDQAAPFEKTLQLIPRILHLGVGCRKGTSLEAIRSAVTQVLQDHGIDPHAVKSAASIDLKAQEQGLLDFCEEAEIPITFYSAEQLRAVPGEFTKSQFVSSITGVDNVCERSAMIGADRLIVKKTACSGVTVAVAEEIWEVHFG